MPSIAESYNQEVLQGHREALAALRELLATETDRTERRRLATAILKTRKVKADEPETPADRGPTGGKEDTFPQPQASHPITRQANPSAEHGPACKSQTAHVLNAVIVHAPENEGSGSV